MSNYDRDTQLRYITQTYAMYAEYEALIDEQSDILDELSEHAEIPSRVREINERMTEITARLQSNAIILADFLSDHLNVTS